MFFNRKPKGKINYPNNRDVVSRLFRAEGTIDSVPAGQYLLVVVQVGGLMWPKGDVQLDNTSWTAEVYEGGTPPDGNFNLCLYLVGGKGYDEIATWLEHGKLTGHYPGLGQIKGGVRLDRVKLHLKS